jgi:hypothetical protein
MNTVSQTEATSIDQADLDRLVDGELDEASRAALLRALDRAPDGWKRCASAFLEAQAWRQALDGRDVAPAITPPAAPGGLLRPLLGLAAAITVAFSAGFVLRSYSMQHAGADAPVSVATQRPQTIGPTGSPGHATAAVADALFGPPAVSEYARLQMERQGYEVKGDRKVVAIGLENGHKLALPVDTVSYRFVGQRIH